MGSLISFLWCLLIISVCYQALVDTNDHEIYDNLTCCYGEKYEKEKGAVGSQLVGERAKIILDEVRDLSLFTRLQCLQHIGTYYFNTLFLFFIYIFW